jgi:outer membrane receptor protein involved in Fe transport
MANRYGWTGAVLASTAFMPLLLAGAAAAQVTAPSNKAAATDVGEVIVTATRKEQSLSKVTESVSAFTNAKLQVLNVKSFADLAKFTPGVTFDSDSHDISVRGIDSSAGSGTTGVYIDDTPVQVRNLGLNANNTLPTVFDLQRVEVLRGPQGTLFGAGSEGGTIRYITTQPSLTRFSGMASSELDFTQDGAPSYELGFALGGPIVDDKLGFRFSAWGRRDGGYIDRVDYQTLSTTQPNANFADSYAMRAALTWAPFSSLKITPAVDYQIRDQNDYDYYWVSISHPGDLRSGTPDKQGDYDHFVMPTLKVEWDAGPVKIISDTAYYNRNEKVGGYSGTLYNLSYFQHFLTGDPNLQSVYGYPSDPQGTPCANNCGALYPLLNANGPNAAVLGALANYDSSNRITNAQQNFTEEFRIQSNEPASRLQWTVGLFYSFNRQQSNEQIFDPQLPQLTQLLWGETMYQAWGERLLPGGVDYDNFTRAHDRQIALYADATYSITDKLKVNVGLRYAWTKFEFLNTNDGAQDLLDDGGVPALSTGGTSEKPFTPKVSLSYQLTPDDMIYSTVAKGYRIGGATPPLPVVACGPGYPDQYDSDSVWSYEVGTKDRFFDRRLSIDTSVYYIRWFNIQQAFYVPLCGIQFTTNAGQAVSKGFDFQGSWQFSHAFQVDASVGYTDAKFVRTSMDASGDVLEEAGDALEGENGPWTATLGLQYNFTVMDKDAFVRLDDEFQSKRTTPNPSEDPRVLTFYDPGARPNPATNQLSIRGGVTLAKWDLAIFINNLTNAQPQLNLAHEDSATALYEAETLRPRTIGLAANFKY